MKNIYLKIASCLCVEAFLLCLLVSCEPVNRYLGLKDDNMAEEAIEMVIKAETGATVDLTPTSPE